MWPNWELLRPGDQNEAGLVRGLAEDDIMRAVSSDCDGWIDIRGFNLVSDYVQPFDAARHIQECPKCHEKYNPVYGVFLLKCLSCGAEMF